MKNVFKYMIVGFVVPVAIISCQKSEVLEPCVNGLTFTSAKPILEDETKTAWNGKSIQWSKGDAIRVAYTCNGVWQNADGSATADEPKGYKTAKMYQSKSLSADAETAQFTVPGDFTGTAAGRYVFYGAYPASACTDGTGFSFAPSLTVTIPSAQTPAADSFDSAADFMLGTSVNTYTGIPTEAVSMSWDRMVAHAQLTFKNLNGFTAGETISKVELTADSEADMVGKHYIYLDTKKVTKPSGTVTNALTINGKNISVDEKGTFVAWASFLPCTVNSLTVVVTTDKATYTREIASCELAFKKNARNILGIKMDQAVRAELTPQPYVLWHESISDGDYIIVGVNGSDYSALNTTISSNRAGLTGVDIVDNIITTNDAAIIWHIEKSGDYYTIYNAGENKYLASTGTKNEAQLLADGTKDMSLWTITGPAEDNTFSIVNKNNTAKNVNANLRRNGNYGFATYASGTGSAPVLYKLDTRELESIAITTPATKTTFNTGDTFSSDGLVVTAKFSDASSSVIVPVVEAPDMSSVGTKTVNVSYTFKEVTKSTSYDIVVEARPAFSVTLSDDSTILTETEAGSGVVLPSRTTNIEGYTFVGWSETECDAKTTTSPTIIPTGTYYPTENVTLYPIYKQTVSSTGWELVTDLSKVTEGVYALVTSTYNNSEEYKAFNGSISSSGHGSTTTSGFEFTNGFAASAPEGTCELTLTVSGSGFTMYKEGKGYLYAKAKKAGNLAWHSSETSYWSYNNSNWTYKYNSAYLRSYSNSSFRTYGSNNGEALWMAKKTTKNVDYYISTPVAE